MKTSKLPKPDHRFLDEAGDTTFYGKGGLPIIGNNGVSKAFILGMVKFKEPVAQIRQKLVELQKSIVSDPYFKSVPSIQKKVADTGYYFHATDDPPEVRKIVYDFILGLQCSFEAVVARKIPALYEKKHNGNESEFYADCLSHLLKTKLRRSGTMILNIAERGKCTRNHNLEQALEKAKLRFTQNNTGKSITTRINFNVQNHTREPILNIADYFCWSIQRIFERGETRYYDFLLDKIPVVIDLYDSDKYVGFKNYYGPNQPLTKGNLL